jgi:subtilisin family serine protease
VSGEILVQFEPDASSYDRSAARSLVSGQVVRVFNGGGERWRLNQGVTTEQAIARMQGNPRVRVAEPNYIVHATLAPTDPQYPNLWGLHNTGQNGGMPGADIDAEHAWNVGTGARSVKVAVIDTGVDYNHPDLAANIWTNPGEIPGNGVDDDHNGFVDDVHGWDFANGDHDPMDDVGHGTHVSGTIGALADNVIGVAGVNWQVTIIPVKFLGNDGSGTVADAITAIDYATSVGARVMNNSWGGGAYSQLLLDAINRAGAAGSLFVAAAGNATNDNDNFPSYPASYDAPNIVSVAALDRNDHLASFSNYGHASVDLGAPGVSILSTLPGGNYGTFSGTSMATPHVSGVAALVLSVAPNLSVSQLKQRLMQSTVPIPSLTGITVTGGRLNAARALAGPDATPPAAITSLDADTPTSYSLTLHWTATGDDGATGTAAEYDIRYSTSTLDEAAFAAATRVAGAPDPLPAGTAQEMQVEGLQFGTTYSFAIKAIDEWGNAGPISNVVTGTTLGPPHFSISPASGSAELSTGGHATGVMTLHNSGVGELTYSVEVQGARVTSAVSTRSAIEPPALARPRVRAEDRPSAVTPPGDPAPSTASYVAGHVASRLPIAGRGSVASSDPETPGPRATELRILILESGGDVTEIHDLLSAFADVTAVDVFDGEAGTPTLDQLRPYNSVIVADNDLFADPTAVGDVLADYADAGGGVVLTLAAFIDGWQLSGRFESDAYDPFNIGIGPLTSSSLGTFDASHPIMQGVTKATGDVLGLVALSPGAVSVASWEYPLPFVATKGPNVAAVNVFVAEPGFWTGDIPLILHNAALWSANASTWLSVSPASGVVPIGGSADLTLAYDATSLGGGDYDASVVLRTNDPEALEGRVPVTLRVHSAPDIRVSPLALDYGSLFVGATLKQRLTVTNFGTSILHVSGLVASDPDYSVDHASLDLATQEKLVVNVTFHPTRTGPIPASLTLTSDDPDTPVLQLPLVGAALPPPLATVEPGSLASTLFTGGRETKILTVRNSGTNPLDFRVRVGLPSPAAAPGPDAAIGEFETLASSPVPMTCVVEDPGAGFIYAQANGGTAFYRYRVATNVWETLASAPLNSRNNGGAALLLGKIYTVYAEENTLMGVYDIASGTWTTQVSPLLDWTSDIASDGVGSLYLAGGRQFVRWDASTGHSVFLPRSPIFFTRWGGLRVLDGAVYGHAGDGTTDFARYVIATRNWEVLPSVPGGAILGATIDPTTREYVTYGSYGGTNLDRYSIDDGAWRVTTIPLFNVNDGGLAWLPGVPNAVYFVQGQNDIGFARLLTSRPFVQVDPRSGIVPPAGSASVSIQFEATSFPGGIVTAEILVDSNDPVHSEFVVPAKLTVLAAPDIAASAGTLDFGSTFSEAPVSRTLTVTNAGATVLHVSGVSIDDAAYSADLSSFDLGVASSRSIDVTFRPGRLGTIAGLLTLASDDPDTPVLRVLLAGTGVPPPVAAIDPSALSIQVFRGQNGARNLVLSNSGGSPLIFATGIASSPEWAGRISVDPSLGTVAASSSLDLKVAIDATLAPLGTSDTIISVASNDPANPALRIPLTITVLLDTDRDGLPDTADNCPGVYNPEQEDSDTDGFGDACDVCPVVADPDQDDTNQDGSGDACQPTVVITSILQDGGVNLEVHARARDPQGEFLYGHVDVIDATPMSVTLHDAFAQADCSLGFLPDGAPNEGIGYGNGSLGAPYLFDLNAALGCQSPAPNFVLALGPCASPPETFDFYLPLDGVALPATICVLRIGAPPGDGLEMQVLDLAPDRIQLRTVTPHVALRSDFFDGPPQRVPLTGLTTGTRYGLSLTVTDANTVPVAATADFLYQGEQWLTFFVPPIAAISGGGVVECAGPDGTQVIVDGTGSSDSDSTPGTNDDIVSYAWFEDNGGRPGPPLSLEAAPSLTLSPGVHMLILKVTDRTGLSATATTVVTVRDTLPPTLTVYADPAFLWPPNHELVPVHTRPVAQDRCDPSVRVTLVSTTSSEADDAPGNADGANANDIQGSDPGAADTDLLLRAEREGKGSGRVYTLTYRATDASGNQAPGLATVTVPHDQGHGPEPLLMRLAPGATASAAMRIDWPAVSGATGYNVIRGSLSSIHVVDGVLKLGAVHVLARGTTDTSVIEATPGPAPAVGQGFFYLIEQVTSIGAVGYGTESAPWPRVPESCDGGCPGAAIATSGGTGGGTVRR